MTTRRAVGLLFLLSALCGLLGLLLAAASRWKAKTRLEGDGKMAQSTFRAIVLVSLGDQKIRELERGGADALRKKATALAKALRPLRGVRFIEGVVAFPSVRIDSHDIKAPWRPAGAIIGLEARSEIRLQENIKSIWDESKSFDQDIVVLEPCGDLDMF